MHVAGASAVLLFGVIESKLAQPRNFFGELTGCPTALPLYSDVVP